MRIQTGDAVVLRRKHLYWVLNGSYTLHACIDSTQNNAEEEIYAHVLAIRLAPRWGNILVLAVQGENPPKDAVLVALSRNCRRN